MKSIRPVRRVFLVSFALIAVLLSGGASAVLGVCGPFTDVSDATFCPFILEIFTLGITTGTTPTTYDPAAAVSRIQMAAFLSRSVDGVLKRGSRRAALNQFWSPQIASVLGITTMNSTGADFVAADGDNLWVSGTFASAVAKVEASTGNFLSTWTGATNPRGLLVAMGRVFVAGETSPGRLYMVNPEEPAGLVTTVANTLGDRPLQAAFNGTKIWTADIGGSVSIVTPGASIPWAVSTVTTGFSSPFGVLYDGSRIWVTDSGAGKIFRVSSTGVILQTVTVGFLPYQALFDGANIWVPNTGSDSVTVVRASTGAVLQTLTGNGLSAPRVAAFDGERVLVTNRDNASVSLWKAADLTAIDNVSTGVNSSPLGACSDGINFWITLNGQGALARF